MTVAWSYSKITAFEKCPRRYHEVMVLKNYTEDSEALREGNEVHKALAKALETRGQLPEPMAAYQRWVDSVSCGPGDLFLEKQYAVAPGFKPTTWFGKDVWFRTIVDALRVDGPVAHAIDWKTGKMRNVDVVQLMLVATAVFAHFSEVKRCRTDFVWLKEDTTSTEDYARNDMVDHWAELLPRVDQFVNATVEKNFPPKPGFLCKNWCPVSTCQFHGK